MKTAIAGRKGSYSDYWITYCEENNIPFIRVNPYDSDIINQVKDCDAFMWHHLTGCRDTQLGKYIFTYYKRIDDIHNSAHTRNAIQRVITNTIKHIHNEIYDYWLRKCWAYTCREII